MLAIIIITLATTTQVFTYNILFPCDWLDYKSKFDLTDDNNFGLTRGVNISTGFYDPSHYHSRQCYHKPYKEEK